MIYRPTDLLYYGDFKENLVEGNGYMYSFREQQTFVGQFKNGKMEGQGTLRSDSGIYEFEGEIGSEGMKTGSLKVRPLDAPNTKTYQVILDDYPNNPIVMINYQDGAVYHGEIDKNSFLPDGHGRINNDVSKFTYEGTWKAG